MNLGGMLDTAILDGNKAFNKIRGSFSSGNAGRVVDSATTMGSRVKSTLGSTYNNGGFAVKAAAGAVAGGAAGYAYDGTDGSAFKGALLGAGGAAAYQGWKNPAMRSAAKDAWGVGKSWGDKAASTIGSYKDKAVSAAENGWFASKF